MKWLNKLFRNYVKECDEKNTWFYSTKVTCALREMKIYDRSRDPIARAFSVVKKSYTSVES